MSKVRFLLVGAGATLALGTAGVLASVGAVTLTNSDSHGDAVASAARDTCPRGANGVHGECVSAIASSKSESKSESEAPDTTCTSSSARWKHDLGGRFVAASVLIVRLEARVGSRASLFLLHAMGDEAAHRDSAGDLSPSPGLGPLHHQHRQPHRHGRREEVDMDHRHILVGRGPDPLSATGGRFFLVS